MGIIQNESTQLELVLNFNTNKNHKFEIKRLHNLFIAIPKEPECLKGDFVDVTITLTEEELIELIEMSYLSKSLVRDIPLAKNEDIIKTWLLTFHNRSNYSSYKELKRHIQESIVYFSNNDKEVLKYFDANINEKDDMEIKMINASTELVTLYLAVEGNTYEWNSIVKINEKIYLKIDDVYVIGLNSNY